MTSTKTYPCSRCDGKGDIRAYGHVMGGVCFKCSGSGQQSSKPRTSIRWTVLSTNPTSGDRGDCYNIQAQTPVKAIARARVLYMRASDDFRAKHNLDDAIAVPADEYWSQNETK